MTGRHGTGFCTGALTFAVGALLLALPSAGSRGDDVDAVEKTVEKPAAPPAKDAPKDAPADKADTEPDDKAGEKPKNPLGNLFKKIFKPQDRGGKRIIPRKSDGSMEPEEEPYDRLTRDHIDARAPRDTGQAKRLRRAREQIERQQWEAALQTLDYVLDPPGKRLEDSLVRTEDGNWISARREANRLLAGLPDEFFDSYQIDHEGRAKSLLEEARAGSDQSKYVEAATRYFHTPSGRTAADYLGTMHFDRGEFGLAARWFDQLLEAGDAVTRGQRWRTKALAAYRLAGDEAGEARLLELLQSGPDTRVHVAETDVGAGAWLKRLAELSRRDDPQLSEWPLRFGTSSRRGTLVGGEPLLLPAWRASSPTTASQRIRDQIRALLSDLGDTRYALVPTIHPVAVGGKVVFRGLRGVRVLDEGTGELLWETAPGISAEALMGGGPVPGKSEVRSYVGNYTGGNGDQHPLTNLLFRDGLWGTVSSDGQRLFVLEDQAVMIQNYRAYRFGRFNPVENDPLRRDFSTNRLTAYDLSSGRPQWEVGGEATNEVFQPTLSGHYFFGTPVVDGDDAFVVAEREGEVRVVAIDAETGAEEWSQLIAFTDVDIDTDGYRRHFGAPVAVGSGVLVCPTTVGWMVAVSRTNHAVLWAYRYAPPQSGRRHRGSDKRVPYQSLNDRWYPSPPVIVGNRVVYTPQEHPTLVCLDLFDGDRLWQKPKGTSLYLAGVFDDRVVTVGRDSVEALDLENGTIVWNRSLPSDAGRPSGRGVAVGDRYYLPLSTGQLWTIDLTNGEVVSKSWLPDDSRPLGNLLMYRGKLLSLDALGLRAFEQKGVVETRLARARAEDPRDPRALLQEAEIHFLHREYQAGLDVLRKIPAERVPENLADRYHAAMTTALVEVVRSDVQSHGRELEELSRIARTPEERLRHQRLLAERLQADGDLEQAFDLYWSLWDDAGVLTVSRTENPAVRVRLDDWVAGKLQDVWEELTPELRERMDDRITARLDTLVEADGPELDRFFRTFRFHDETRAREWTRLERRGPEEPLVHDETRLRQLAREEQPEVAGRALDALGRLLLEAGRPRDAAHFFAQLERRFPDYEIDGKPAQTVVRELRESGTIPAELSESTARWGEYDLDVSRSTSSYSSNSPQSVDVRPAELPYFRDHRFEVLPQTQRLGILNAEDDDLEWLPALPARQRYNQGNRVVAVSSGHLLYLLYRDTLIALSPVDKKPKRSPLWYRRISNRNQIGAYYRTPQSSSFPPMQQGPSLPSSQGLPHQARLQGMLAVANGDYACVHDRQKFTVLDARTGDVRWEHVDLPQGTQVYGNEDFLIVVPPDRDDARVLRARDGKRLDVPGVAELVNKTLRLTRRGMVLVETKSANRILGLAGLKTHLRLYDPLSGQDVWKTEGFPRGTLFSMLGESRVVVLQPEGEMGVLDLDSGAMQSLDRLPEADLRGRSNVYAVADRQRLYLLVNSPRTGGFGHFGGQSLPSIHVNGQVVAYDQSSGKRLWKQAVSNQHLLLPYLESTPFLVFTIRRYVNEDGVRYWSTRVLALDKFQGRRLYDDRVPSSNSFQSMKLNMADRYVELRSYNDKLRLRAVPRKETTEASE